MCEPSVRHAGEDSRNINIFEQKRYFLIWKKNDTVHVPVREKESKERKKATAKQRHCACVTMRTIPFITLLLLLVVGLVYPSVEAFAPSLPSRRVGFAGFNSLASIFERHEHIINNNKLNTRSPWQQQHHHHHQGVHLLAKFPFRRGGEDESSEKQEERRTAIGGGGDDRRGGGGPVVNLSLVRQTLLNQGLIGITIWTGGNGYQVLQNQAHILNNDGSISTSVLLMALLGVLPLIFFSRQIETSEAPAVADLNISTNMLVLRLFGDQSQPITALFVSLLLASVTGLVEETTFRGQVLPQIKHYFNDNLPIGFLLSTLLFAILHINPIALIRGGIEGIQDAIVLVLYQLVTGAWFATLYILSGNLAVSIITHSFFDTYVFFGTHLIVSSQMEYARNQAIMPVASNSNLEAKWQQKRGERFVLGARETFYLADSNRDGVLSREELRIALYSYGIRLTTEESATVTRAADIDKSGTIDFGEFLEFVGPTGSAGKAIKTSLLGVNG